MEYDIFRTRIFSLSFLLLGLSAQNAKSIGLLWGRTSTEHTEARRFIELRATMPNIFRSLFPNSFVYKHEKKKNCAYFISQAPTEIFPTVGMVSCMKKLYTSSSFFVVVRWHLAIAASVLVDFGVCVFGLVQTEYKLIMRFIEWRPIN